MIDIERQDALLVLAKEHLMAAHDAINIVSNMHWNSDRDLESICSRIESLYGDVATYGQPPQE